MKEFVEKLIERLEKEIAEYDVRIQRRKGACYYDESQKQKKLDERARGIEQAIEIVNQLAEEYNQDSTKKNQGWIPVAERLPEDCDHRFYMCIVENHEEDLPMFCQYEEDYGFGFWQDFYDEHTLGFLDSEFRTNEELGYEKVIAWQPLPEPYKVCEVRQDLDKLSQESKTRIDHIRSMSVEEMADAILERSEISTAIDFCQNFEQCYENVPEEKCRECLIKYLNSPVEQKKVIPTEHFEERFSRVI